MCGGGELAASIIPSSLRLRLPLPTVDTRGLQRLYHKAQQLNVYPASAAVLGGLADKQSSPPEELLLQQHRFIKATLPLYFDQAITVFLANECSVLGFYTLNSSKSLFYIPGSLLVLSKKPCNQFRP